MVRRKGESPACTHVYLYIGRAKDLRWRKWQGGGGVVSWFSCLGSNKQLHSSAGHEKKKQRERQLRCRVSGFTPCSDPLAIELRSAEGGGPSPPVCPETSEDQGSGAALYWYMCWCRCIQLEGAYLCQPTNFVKWHSQRWTEGSSVFAAAGLHLTWYSAGIWWHNDRRLWLYDENVTADFYLADLGEVLNPTKHFPFLEWYVLENKVID